MDGDEWHRGSLSFRLCFLADLLGARLCGDGSCQLGKWRYGGPLGPNMGVFLGQTRYKVVLFFYVWCVCALLGFFGLREKTGGGWSNQLIETGFLLSTLDSVLCIVVYAWTLIAPTVCPDRDFDFT